MIFTSRIGIMATKEPYVQETKRLLAVGHGSSPRVSVYKQTSNGFTKLSDPDVTPTGYGSGVSFSPDGKYLAIAHATNPYLSIYTVSDTGLTKLPNPSGLPPSNANGCSFSDDGAYLAVAHFNTPYITLYSVVGDSFERLPNPTVLPAGTATSCSFSPDGAILAVSLSASPYLALYSITNGTFNAISNPTTLPTGTAYGCDFSSDGLFLSVPHTAYPYVSIYSRTGTNFVKIANPSNLPTGDGRGSNFSKDGTYLAIAHKNNPFITIYSISGNTFSKVTNPTVLPAGNSWGCVFSVDENYLYVAHEGSPYITNYLRSGDEFSALPNVNIPPTGTGYACAYYEESDTEPTEPPPPPPPPPPPTEDGIVQIFNFEQVDFKTSSGDSGVLTISGNSPERSNVRSRVGEYSMRTYLNRLSSLDMYRTEVSHKIAMETNNGADTQDYWFGFSFYIPSPYPVMTFPVYEIFWQVHTSPIDGIWTGYYGMNPPLSFFVKPETSTSGNFQIFVRATDAPYPQTGNSVVNNTRTPYVTNRWYNFVVNSRFDCTANGFTKVWLDGVQIVNYTGMNYFLGHGPAYDKFGLYTGWRGSRIITGEVVNERTLFHDEYRFAYGGTVGYDTVYPGG